MKAQSKALILVLAFGAAAMGIGVLWFLECSHKRKAMQVGEAIKLRLNVPAGQFGNVELRYAVAGGLLVVQARPVLSGRVQTTAELHDLELAVRETCTEHGWDANQVPINVKVDGEPVRQQEGVRSDQLPFGRLCPFTAPIDGRSKKE